MTRELVLLTFEGWGALTPPEVNRVLDAAQNDPGVRKRLIISDDWFADITYENGSYVLTQGRTAS